ncbi:hypothetical protein C6558_31800 [Ensifer sp. NM-2]|uniref:hypothetical protein n=1 Tax=Ensifer sp. NM-2 TaxID=2109730 RepID=UPI000D119764|nr:hypothetical protein [Ensifer sp. NM-2]PSS60572.1 hypothetical protein C6558_31800 [Ensifer sp. NM-2]
MKSPWKLFSEFITRRDPQGEPPLSDEEYKQTASDDRPTEELRPSAEPALSAASVDFGSLRQSTASHGSIGALTETAADPNELEVRVKSDKETSANIQLAEPSQQRGKAIAPTVDLKRSRKATRSSRIHLGHHGLNASTNGSVAGLQDPMPVQTFRDEVVGLDDDIRKLRLELSQKLAIQNLQLKKMLSRFDIQ